MIGYLAVSLAGHDKNKIYMIIEENETSVFLSDGNIRPLDQMKCKKKKHIQIIKKTLDEDLAERIRTKGRFQNEEIKHALKIYQKELANK